MTKLLLLIVSSKKEGDWDAFEKLYLSRQDFTDALVGLDAARGFHVHRTKDAIETVWVLGCMTKAISKLLAMKLRDFSSEIDKAGSFRPVNYIAWKESVKKTTEKDCTVGNIFGRQLRMIPGCHAEKVSALLERYPTASKLIAAYRDNCLNRYAEETLLYNLKWGWVQPSENRIPEIRGEKQTSRRGRFDGKLKVFGSWQSLILRDFFRSYDYEGCKSASVKTTKSKGQQPGQKRLMTKRERLRKAAILKAKYVASK
eukprot:jgi/Bigna1/76178/fgenesh1_pg.39_\